MGFWTPDYVARKLALYRSARLSNLILCIDEGRNCAEADLPAGALVVRFRRRVDAAGVLRMVETTHCPPLTGTAARRANLPKPGSPDGP